MRTNPFAPDFITFQEHKKHNRIYHLDVIKYLIYGPVLYFLINKLISFHWNFYEHFKSTTYLSRLTELTRVSLLSGNGLRWTLTSSNRTTVF